MPVYNEVFLESIFTIHSSHRSKCHAPLSSFLQMMTKLENIVVETTEHIIREDYTSASTSA